MYSYTLVLSGPMCMIATLPNASTQDEKNVVGLSVKR